MTDQVGLDDHLVLCKLVSHSATDSEDVRFSLRIHRDFSWTLLFLGQHLNCTTCPMLRELPQTLPSVDNLEVVLKALDVCTVCISSQDEKFSDLVKSHKGVFMDASGRFVCYCQQ